MSEVKKILFIVNKFAGTGYQPQLEGRIIEACEKHDVECTIEFTQAKGHATTLSREASTLGFDRVVAVGGDGTMNEVAQGLVHGNIPMGIIPRGSGNGLARHLGIPIHISKALENLFIGKILPIDTFTLNNKLSLNVSGIGFDGHIAELFGGKSRRGLLGYTKLALQEFFAFPEFESRISFGTHHFERRAFVIAIANSSQYGNNARIAPAASVCDGVLHINVLKKVPAYRFDFVYAFFAGTVAKSSYCEIIQSDHFTIETKEPIPYHVDGEPCGLTNKLFVQVQPAALPLIIPHHKTGSIV